MKPHSLILIFTLLISYNSRSQNIPEGYILLYEQNFSSAKALNDFNFSNPKAWGISNTGNNYYLHFQKDTSYKPRIVSPSTIGILNNFIFGDFIMEADLMLLGTDSILNEICIYLSFKDSLKYYYIQLAGLTNENTHGVFIVNKSPPIKISSDSTENPVFNKDTWHKLRIERDILRRTVKVFYRDPEHPILESVDYEFVMGYIGFGAFSGSGCVDNIKIWAPTYIPEKTQIFNESPVP